MRVKESKMHKERLPPNEQFCLGLMDDLGVSFCAIPKFDWNRWQVNTGLTGDLCVSIYADPKFD